MRERERERQRAREREREREREKRGLRVASTEFLDSIVPVWVD